MNVLGCVKKRTRDYEKGFEDGRIEGVKQAVKFLLYGVVQYLGDKRGWTRESIFKAIMWLNKYAIMISEEYTTFPETMDAVREEYGIAFVDGNFVYLEDWKG